MKTINFIPNECIDCKSTKLAKDVVKAQIPEQSVHGTYLCENCELLMVVKLPPKTMLLELRKTIVFIFIQKEDTLYPKGTGFFVKLPIEHIHNGYQRYFVTAKHVIIDKAGNFLKEIILRVNKKVGGVIYDRFPLNEEIIFQHEDKNVDLIAIPVTPQNYVDYKSIPLEIITDDEILSKTGLGEGDEVFFSGLFHHHIGKDENMPLYRFGKMSVMSNEKIKWKEEGKLETEVNLYLMECYSTKGSSGSPVFFRVTPQHETMMMEKPHKVYLAGVLMGGFQDPVFVKTYDEKDKGLIAENLGITAITPAYKLRELLLSGDALNHRKTLQEKPKE